MDHDYRALIALPMLLAFGGLGARAGASAGPSEDPAEVLQKAQAKTLASLKQSRDYTCVQNVTRMYYSTTIPIMPRACTVVLEDEPHPNPSEILQLHSLDRLRLDVTLTKGGETYGWAGASRFEDGGVEAVVRRGPIGSGLYAGFLAVIFGGEVKAFHYVGESFVDGREVFEYSFQVPLQDSNYKLKTVDSWANVAYEGAVRIDPATGNVVQLQVNTIDPPKATQLCQAATTLDFQAANGETPLLLPARSHQRFVYPNSAQALNMIDFANCREYLGESTITYGPSPDAVAPAAKAAVAAPPPIEGGLPFTLELLEPIETDHAAAGDAFHAQLAADLRDSKRNIVARAGAIVDGRLRRVEVFPDTNRVVLVIAPTAIWIGKDRVRLSANLDWNYLARLYRTNSKKALAFDLPDPAELPGGLFRFSGSHFVVPKGFRSVWRSATVRTQP